MANNLDDNPDIKGKLKVEEWLIVLDTDDTVAPLFGLSLSTVC